MRVLNAGAAPLQLVRPAQPADAQLLTPLCAAHADFERLPFCAYGHSERLQTALVSGLLHAWLLVQGGAAVGYASVTLDWATLSAHRFAHLDCLYLQPGARGQGGGQALMYAVQLFAQSQACVELQWQTPAWNHSAIHFYDHLGAAGVAKQRYTLPLPRD
ncbi:GNAT family N-acetyltransferase [Rhodoferax sp. BLA1]|uniref:GNAT family N-acetyltransferase n=1 Tax=Rhodoferax sp. BLA1 TaxID=2576062 RepID=UPI0015D0E91E|nr:GNAT family N-acetyltransferase [Rhodoferax sp. BLA1]